MLYSRIRLVLDYVRAVKEGELPRNHDALRAAHTMCRRLPALRAENLTQDLYDVSVGFM